mmetsp:Transcript_127643/g.303291  ORF Transcript_127643/g.303291 Transcript_127643/m.303291 type:complete len:189 (-) Transcript_127643:69-635(-)
MRCLWLILALPAEGLRRSTCGLAGACPGSPVPWAQHASCTQTVLFHNSCKQVQQEIEARIHLDADRKELPGNYTLLSTQEGLCTKGSRRTSPLANPGPFTDLFGFLYESKNDGSDCLLTGCSESQVKSICDFSTNFCNMFNLYCNEAEGCQSKIHSLAYDKASFFENCQHVGPKCSGLETQTSQCTKR